MIDTSLDEKEVAAIRATLLATPGVQGLHELRTRRMGDRALVDAHVLVDPKISVSEGHYIAETARARVLKAASCARCDGAYRPGGRFGCQAQPAPAAARSTACAISNSGWAQALPAVNRVVLHYLDGKVEAEIFLPAMSVREQIAALQSRNRRPAARTIHFSSPFICINEMHHNGALSRAHAQFRCSNYFCRFVTAYGTIAFL